MSHAGPLKMGCGVWPGRGARTVVAEHLDLGAREPAAEDERRVVELVADDERPGPGEHGQVGRVGGKAHAKDNGRGLAHKLGDQGLELVVLRGRA